MSATRGSTTPQTTQLPTSTLGPTTMVPTTTTPQATTTRSTAPPTTAPRPTAPPTTVAPVRTVGLGETFSAGVGETVSVPAAGLSVTFIAVVSDNRCPPGVQCIVAGSATITVTVAKAGTPAASLSLGTHAPKSATYGTNTVELIQLGRGTSPVATLRVT